eukprot:gene4880-8692_t
MALGSGNRRIKIAQRSHSAPCTLPCMSTKPKLKKFSFGLNGVLLDRDQFLFLSLAKQQVIDVKERKREGSVWLAFTQEVEDVQQESLDINLPTYNPGSRFSDLG